MRWLLWKLGLVQPSILPPMPQMRQFVFDGEHPRMYAEEYKIAVAAWQAVCSEITTAVIAAEATRRYNNLGRLTLGRD